MRAVLFCSLVLSLVGCASAPMRAPSGSGHRKPAASLPAGYQVKAQDHWTLSHFENEDQNSFRGICQIRKTGDGFEAGSSKDQSGSAVMKLIGDAADVARVERLTHLTGKGIEDGYGPYWSDCGDPKKTRQCVGSLNTLSFMEFEGAQEMPGSKESADIYDQRTVAVERGGLWYSSSQANEMYQIAKCLCGRYAREDEKEFFNDGNDACSAPVKAKQAAAREPNAEAQSPIPIATCLIDNDPVVFDPKEGTSLNRDAESEKPSFVLNNESYWRVQGFTSQLKACDTHSEIFTDLGVVRVDLMTGEASPRKVTCAIKNHQGCK